MNSNKNFSLFLLFLLCIPVLNAQSPQLQTVLDQETYRFVAMMKADTSALRPMLSDDLVYVHSNGLTESKAEHLASISSGKLVYQKMQREAANVRFYGKTALVNGTLKVSGLLNGTAFELQLLYLAAYRKKRGHWQLVHWQSTKAKV